MTADDRVTIHHGDCLDVLRTLPDNSVDAVVTDPPYGLGFMGKAWDDLPPGREWAEECLRVLKPGGFIAAFGGTRTFHRLACAIEDAGFEIRDSIGYGHAERPGLLAWAYGSGFPKSMNVTKALEALGVEDAPQGLGTALKPAWEPIVLARKPLSESTVAANVLRWSGDGRNGGQVGSSSEGSGSEARARGCAVHPLHGVRNDGASGSLSGGAAEVADNLRSGVHGQADERPAESELAGRRLDRGSERVSPSADERTHGRGQGATADTATAGRPGTPAGDGPEDRPAVEAGRDGAPHQRREGGQPAGEPAPHRLGGAQQGASVDRAGAGRTPSGERSTEGCTCGGPERISRAAHGTGALNIDGCRVATDENLNGGAYSAGAKKREDGWTTSRPGDENAMRNGAAGDYVAPAGRWPTNVVMDGDAADALDEQSGILKSGDVAGSKRRTEGGNGVTHGAMAGVVGASYADQGGASRFFPVFRYQAKAPARERVKVDGVAHPTVKPLELMRWLVRLVTPPGGVVLDPFAGSGTTVEACLLEGFHCIAIEREATYLPLIYQRIARCQLANLTPAGDDTPTLFDLEEPA